MILMSIGAIAFYAVALVMVASRLTHEKGPNRSLVAGLGAAAVICHALLVYQHMFAVEGQDFSVINVGSLVCLIISASFVVILNRVKVMVMVPVVFALSIVSIAVMMLIPDNYTTHFETAPELSVHIVLSLLAYSVLMIAALYAVQLNAIQNKLKNRQLILSPALPPLMTVEKQLYHLVMAGVILLTLSLATGFIFLDDMFAEGKGHKAILSMLAWAVYTHLLVQHYRRGVRIRTAVLYTWIGAILLSLAYFGARIVKEMILG
ncbi:cytochrome C assembly family protein [Paraferrimonas sedimenticola]|uniref:Cytochrome c assembly protein n=1 Tax=Paraferrimonas sedimenticola TaxID=375674 RepID=A0AA37W197_9GAMM|nr:cytochrome c biogenesis protein CcsA [Paraferrimonas sedimenticola]GLP97180.1 cytochrome c assembly protein [Paraferrimonas sedimenticola]